MPPTRGPNKAKAPAPAASRRGADRKRTAKQPLSRERIVLAALEEVRLHGLAQLSTRRLGQRLGCEAMSIYHHFPSKAHLLDALVDHAIASVEPPPAHLSPFERLRFICYAHREMAHRFPALYPLVAIHRLNTPTGVRYIDSVLATIREVEPDPEKAARQFRAIGYYLTGASLDETSGYAKGPSAAEPVSDAYVAEHCKALIAASPYFKREHWDTTFEYGLQAMMASFASDMAARGD